VRFCTRWEVSGRWFEVCLFDDHFLYATKPASSAAEPEFVRVEHDVIAGIDTVEHGALTDVTLTTTSGTSETVPCPRAVAAALLTRWTNRPGAEGARGGSGPDAGADPADA
jgi:hypothetical protein